MRRCARTPARARAAAAAKPLFLAFTIASVGMVVMSATTTSIIAA